MTKNTTIPGTDRITLDLDKDGWTGGLQLSIQRTRPDGGGDGYRLHGPKYNGSGKNLISHEIDQRDAEEIRGYLNAAFPLAVWWIKDDNGFGDDDPELFTSQRASREAAIRSYRDANDIGRFDDDSEPGFAWREHRDGGVELYVDDEATGLIVRQLTVQAAAKNAQAVAV